MTLDTVCKHIRTALDDVAASDKKQQVYEKSDANIARRIEGMRPVMDALEALRREIADVKDGTISSASHGHIATIELKGGASTQRLVISATHENSLYEIEDRTYHSFDAETAELMRKLSTANEVLKLVVGAVGKHVAAIEALDERRK